MNNFKLLKGYTNLKFIPVLEPGVRWIDTPELEICYYDGQSIQRRRYHCETFNLRDTSLRSFMDENPDAYIGIFMATHYPTGNNISVQDANTHLLDFRQPDMIYRMAVINDLMRPEPNNIIF